MFIQIINNSQKHVQKAQNNKTSLDKLNKKKRSNNIYFFFRVKNDRFFGSSFCDVAGNVIERPSPPVKTSDCCFNACTHCCISVSSWACNKNSPPFVNLKEINIAKN